MSPPSFADGGRSTSGSSATPSFAGSAYPYLLDEARRIEREHPAHLAALGMNAEQYARGMMGPSLTIDESIEAGWMSAAEGRYIQGCATLDDLLELGHSREEAHEILLDQQERACASST
jgi:hypothetical protein